MGPSDPILPAGGDPEPVAPIPPAHPFLLPRSTGSGPEPGPSNAPIGWRVGLQFELPSLRGPGYNPPQRSHESGDGVGPGTQLENRFLELPIALQAMRKNSFSPSRLTGDTGLAPAIPS